MTEMDEEQLDQVHDHLVKPLLKPFFPNQNMEEKRIKLAAEEFNNFLKEAIDENQHHLLNIDESAIHKLNIEEINKQYFKMDSEIKDAVFQLKAIQQEEESLLSHFIGLAKSLDSNSNNVKRIKDYFDAFYYEIGIRSHDKKKLYDKIVLKEEQLTKHIKSLETNFQKMETNYDHIKKWHEIRSLRQTGRYKVQLNKPKQDFLVKTVKIQEMKEDLDKPNAITSAPNLEYQPIKINEKDAEIDETSVYDWIVDIDLITTIAKDGWKVYLSKKFSDYQKAQEQLPYYGFGKQQKSSWEGAAVAVVGLYDKGKTFVLNNLTSSNLPSGKKVNTKGVSFKHVDVDAGTHLILVDTAGSYSPVRIVNELSIVEKEATEMFIMDLVFEISDYFICVVNDFTSLDQRYLDRLSRNLQNSPNKTFREIIVIHNLKEVESPEILEHVWSTQVTQIYSNGSIQRTKVAAVNPVNNALQEKHVLWFKTEFTRHVCLVNDDSYLGISINPWVFSLLRYWLKSVFVPVNRQFSVVDNIVQFSKAKLSSYFRTNLSLKIQDTDELLVKVIVSQQELNNSNVRIPQVSIDSSGLIMARPDSFLPNTDIIATDQYIIYMDVPGLTKDEILVYRQNVVTIIKGVRKRPYDSEKLERSERKYGEFALSFKIPEIYERKWSLFSVEDGVLTIVYDKDKDDQIEILSDIYAIKDKDKLISSYLSFRGLQKQHIDSFNYLIESKISQIVFSALNRKITCESDPTFLLEYTGIRVDNPTHLQSCDLTTRRSLLYPNECRLSDLTYAGDIYVNVKIYLRDNDPVDIKDVKIGRMPIMLGSSKCNLSGKTENEIYKNGECPYDPKGYFIIKGVEKAILIQEQLVDNRIIVDYNSKTDSLETQVQSYHLETKSKASIIMKKHKLYVKSSSFKDAPLFIFFKALGIESDKEIIELIGTEKDIVDKLILSFEDLDKKQVYTQLDALKYIGKSIKNKYGAPTKDQQAIDQAREKLAQVFLAHVNCKKYDFQQRAVYLGLMVRRLLLAMQDKRYIDNRDYYGNKRMRCAGQMIELLFEDRFKQFNSTIQQYLKKELGKSKAANKQISVQDIVLVMGQNKDIITEGLNSAIGTGNWQIKRFNMDRKGVSQLLARISYTAAMGMMTKISSQLQKTRKISGPRALLGSHFGMICPSDTPDGESCGLVKTLALLTHITNEHDEEKVLNLMITLGVEDLGHFKPRDYHKKYLVFLNGNIIGLHNHPIQLANDIRTLRRNGKINEFVSVYIDDVRRLLSVSSDAGRLVRPLIIVKDGIPQLQQKDLEDLKNNDAQTVFANYVKKGKIEYLDVNESDNAYIALTHQSLNKEVTHMEIDQMTILSCVSGLIPFPHHNQSPRNTYQCQMGKQSIGIIGMNQLNRCDTVLYLLIYPQTPLVRTISMEAIHQTKLPAGHNAQVAVMSYSCYDIEDALIMNKSSLDRGLGRTAVYRRYETECVLHTKDGQYRDVIVGPPNIATGKNQKKHVPKRYHALDEDGITKVGSQLTNGDVFVNKLTPKVPLSAMRSFKEHSSVQTEREWIESPSVFKSHWNYNVDKVILTNENDLKKVKTVLRQIRRPELGDKFSSRHGQKGVIGLIVNAEDMPFNEQGWCPDLIMNPHGYPSRMTVGKLMELLCGKLGALQGEFKYGTAFAGEDISEVGRELLKRGFNYQGKDCLISGITGEYMDCYVYQGPIFYQRLKHMVIDKIHARGRGPYQTLTRQPVEGRAKDGGQRLGEMERDCLLAYGASNLLLERLLISSDPFQVWVCSICGMFKANKLCESCNTDLVYQVKLPYACKLMFQELLAMNIKPKLNLVPVHERQEYTIK